MGRARSQTPAGAGERFDAVVGPRRGLGVAANAQREAVELCEHKARELRRQQRERERVLDFYAKQVRETSGSSVLVRALAQAHADGACNPEDSGWEALVDDLWTRTKPNSALAELPPAVNELAAIAHYGDPAGCPGLSAPAVLVLARYYDVASKAAFAPQASMYRQHDTCIAAGNAITLCFYWPRSPEHYQRLQPLADSLGLLLARAHTRESQRVCETAANVLMGSVSTSAAAGPLRSWVNALAERCDANGFFSQPKRATLLAAVEARSRSSELAEAVFAPLLQSLQRRD
jgi:hypothetical protein